ncbi:hypothetical protein CesoFtcFv8_005677 [Champsocephalus esox]|uniref:Uncharacterized protein n=1 Tax=Champsocephalus esox TaxID=159716 RepID=A0AAN8CVH8_9TELE|nr:hypothetical protein CesoFtcFv8_005677 [Champsocephalus esox]
MRSLSAVSLKPRRHFSLCESLRLRSCCRVTMSRWADKGGTDSPDTRETRPALFIPPHAGVLPSSPSDVASSTDSESTRR